METNENLGNILGVYIRVLSQQGKFVWRTFFYYFLLEAKDVLVIVKRNMRTMMSLPHKYKILIKK